ncbi:MAG: DNA polymerase III subunit alpha [Bacteroidetes bacterium]|nr:DNA polymerase III subunit alpha [Bacteroidota bacterium]MBU1373820.1 DNA polymerase III subunit alpha [Bacteroidota bacterium]MBU1483926.1 DNA polymerase III subunit alpha [Bacteroidota bacterium]MBU1760950.1 DNA polymerase III subunit alpha [Bacteroidota bacterium]MBU2374531.1 DNA polymerase III subunit alpha [Bacteroidota bacterium]
MYLNCHSYFSFLYGTLSPAKLLDQAKRHGVERFVLTDINNTSGCLEIARRTNKSSFSPIFGIDFRNDLTQQFVGIAKNQDGFEKLNRLLSEHLKNETPFDYKCGVKEDVFIIYPFKNDVDYYLEDHEFIGINYKDLHYLRLDKWNSYQDKMVILHSVSFADQKDIKLHQLLRAIQKNTIISKIKEDDLACADEVFFDEQAFINHYGEYPKLLRNTFDLLESCEVIDFELGKNKNKSTFSPHSDKSLAKEADYLNLVALVEDGAKYRYKHINQKVRDRIKNELQVIKEGNYISYFLINHDIISYAHKRGFYYIGRGSGANSIVAYCLKITDVDPIELDLYFERFINVFRKTPPDFDIDFSWQDRDEIIQYIFDKYSLEHTCLQATYTTFQANSTYRELGKVYGLPTSEIEELADRVKHGNKPDKKKEKLYCEIYKYAQKLKGFPKNLSIHAGGILISDEPIYRYTATSHPPKGFPVCQFDMYNAEDLGLYKFDILSQRGLGHIKDTLAIVKENRGVEIDIHDISKFMKDEKIVKHLEKGNLVGCFYVESPAMRMLLAKLECKDYLTLVAASSIIRPGVAQSGMMREYVLRHHRSDKGEGIAHPVLWDLMADTYGVMVYQEDVIKVAYHFAGLNLSESDVLRRGMSGKYRSREEFQKVRDKFFANCDQMARERSLAIEVWRQIESFAGYSFAKGHSASFAVESYQSMYLKSHFPLDFMVGVINNFGGFYRTGLYVHEAQKAGAKVEAPCLNRSQWLTAITGDVIFLGFIHVKGLENKLMQNALQERELNGNFLNLNDFTDRVSVRLEQLITLIRVGGFRFTKKSKQALLWDAHFLMNKKPVKNIQNRLFKTSSQANFKIPDLYHDVRNDMLDELELLEFMLLSPFKLMENQDLSGIKAKEIPSKVGQEVQIIGQLVTTKYAKTKHGDTLFFGTFLDESGYWIDTVLFPDVAARFSFRGYGCYLIKGKVTEEFNFFTIEVSYMEKLGWWNAQLAADKEDSKLLSV